MPDPQGFPAMTDAKTTLEPIPLADHDEIGRIVRTQPWEIQKAIVTITAHCTVLADELRIVADLAGCISQCCMELARALPAATAAPDGVREALKAARLHLVSNRALEADRAIARALAALAAAPERLTGEARIDEPCDDCPPVDYPTDKTRCLPCPRRVALPSTDRKEGGK